MQNQIQGNPTVTDEREVRDTILSNLHTLNGGNNIKEVRILTPKGVWSGTFSDMATLSDAVMQFNGAHNIFVTLNPITDSITVTNKLQKAKNATTDDKIVGREWLLVDIDPKRPSKTSATDEEQELAKQTAVELKAFLSANGLPTPITALSGNGIHCLYRIDMPNDKESYDLIKSFLEALDSKFSNEQVEIDKSVSKASQLTKLYGTMAVKGENTAERPHRQSQILDIPETIEIVTAEQINAVIALIAPPQAQPAATPEKSKSADKGKSGKKWDVEAFISNNNIEVINAKKETPEYTLWNIVCPFCGEPKAFIQQFDNGINARCHRDSCEWEWKDLRAKFDPQYAEKKGLAAIPEHLIPYNNMILATRKDEMYIDSSGNIYVYHGSGYSAQWSVLSNFVPVPLEILHEVDGIEDDIKKTTIKIGGWLEGHTAIPPITIDKDKLYSNKWATELDFRAIINSSVGGGHGKLREIIQIFSSNIPHITTYTHAGFRMIDGKPCFLHSGGAIGRDNVSVNLEQNHLSGYELEDVRGQSVEDRRECIKTALKVIDIHRYGNVLFAYTFLAPLCDMFSKQSNTPAFSLWLYGKSDTHKSSVAAALLNFFGKGFFKNSLPLSFNDTGNSITKKLFLLKDVLTVIDDVIHPTAVHSDIKRQKKLAQDLIFVIANRSGRGRMNGDETLKKTLTPQGMTIFTAEHAFDYISESTTSRLLALEFEKGGVNLDILTECQKSALNLNKTMAGFITHLIENADTLNAELQQRFEQLRGEALSGNSAAETSKKLVELCAFMHIAMDIALQYFIEAGAVTEEYKTAALIQLDEDLQALVEKQSAAIVTTSPTAQFIDAVSNMFALDVIYTKRIGGTGAEEQRGKTWVGFHDHNNYYFPVGDNTGGIFVAAKQFLRQHDVAWEIQPKELYRRLAGEGVIIETEKGRYSRVKTISGKSWRVLVIPKSVFSSGESTDEDLDDSTFEE